MHPRTQVIRMLDMMAEGKRIDVVKDGNVEGHTGAIASLKGEKIFILLYNHQLDRTPKIMNTISLQLNGSQVDGNKKWLMNEWRIDQDHGVWVYEMYKDFENGGLKPLLSAPIYDGNSKERFGSGWRDIFEKNKAKYQKMTESTMTTKGKPVQTEKGMIRLKYDMPGHSVRLIELIQGVDGKR